MRLAVAACLIVIAGPGWAEINGFKSVDGVCIAASHTAEGPINSDLTKRQSRFFCDAAAITFYDDYEGHTMIQFVEKESRHPPIIGFSGKLDSNGVLMEVENVYFSPNQSFIVSEGACKFFYRSPSKSLSGVTCGIKIDEAGRRTTALIGFEAAQ